MTERSEGREGDSPTVDTLGDIAEVFEAWRDSGITAESIIYVVNKVWWDRA